jgi:hypothetical protein
MDVISPPFLYQQGHFCLEKVSHRITSDSESYSLHLTQKIIQFHHPQQHRNQLLFCVGAQIGLVAWHGIFGRVHVPRRVRKVKASKFLWLDTQHYGLL